MDVSVVTSYSRIYRCGVKLHVRYFHLVGSRVFYSEIVPLFGKQHPRKVFSSDLTAVDIFDIFHGEGLPTSAVNICPKFRPRFLRDLTAADFIFFGALLAAVLFFIGGVFVALTHFK